MMGPTKKLRRLTHDVKAACANLRTAADMLSELSEPDLDEYLKAMSEQVENLAGSISEFKAQRKSNG